MPEQKGDRVFVGSRRIGRFGNLTNEPVVPIRCCFSTVQPSIAALFGCGSVGNLFGRLARLLQRRSGPAQTGRLSGSEWPEPCQLVVRVPTDVRAAPCHRDLGALFGVVIGFGVEVDVSSLPREGSLRSLRFKTHVVLGCLLCGKRLLLATIELPISRGAAVGRKTS